MSQHLKCVNCNGSSFSGYLVLNQYEYKRCNECNLVQLVPLPTTEDLKNYYSSEYYNEHYNAEKDQYEAISLHNSIHVQIVKNHFNISPSTSVLDYGCGMGYFLASLKNLGYNNISGFEFNKVSAMVLNQKGIDYYDIHKEKDRNFDIITLWAVAEHLTDPIDTFKFLKTRLNKGGILVIGTVRIDDFVDKTSFGYTMWADPPAHTLLFNKQNLIAMIKKVGFTDVEIECDHSINNIYNSKYQLLKRLLKKIILFYKTDRKNKRGDFGSYIVAIAKN